VRSGAAFSAPLLEIFLFTHQPQKNPAIYVCVPAAQTERDDCLCDVQRFFCAMAKY